MTVPGAAQFGALVLFPLLDLALIWLPWPTWTRIRNTRTRRNP